MASTVEESNENLYDESYLLEAAIAASGSNDFHYINDNNESSESVCDMKNLFSLTDQQETVHLNYNSLRESNIARNEMYLANLLGEQYKYSKLISKNESFDNSSKNNTPFVNYGEQLLTNKRLAVEYFIERDEELAKICAFLNEVILLFIIAYTSV